VKPEAARSPLPPAPKGLNVIYFFHKLIKKMTSYRQIYFHIVFGTKHHKAVIPDENCEELYKYIWGTIKNMKCRLYRINGSREHLHLLSDLHPSIALSDFVRDIKTASSKWMKQNDQFGKFAGWSEGYAAFTITHNDRNRIIEYIKNQKEHHKREDFSKEYMRLLVEHEIIFDKKFLD
jgi:putative transposase